MRILIVEDDLLVAAGLKQGLEHVGFTVDHARTAALAQGMLAAEQPALAIVDLGLPDLDGTALIGWLRRRGMHFPVMVLTARDSLEDTVTGLEIGADDYLVKPFRLPEIIARIRALVRRSHARTTSTIRVGELVMDTACRTLHAAGDVVEISPREWTILEHLMLAAPRVVAKDKLLQQLAGWDEDLTPNTIEVHISRLRQKIPPQAGIAIRTVRGLGYRVQERESGADA